MCESRFNKLFQKLVMYSKAARKSNKHVFDLCGNNFRQISVQLNNHQHRVSVQLSICL